MSELRDLADLIGRSRCRHGHAEAPDRHKDHDGSGYSSALKYDRNQRQRGDGRDLQSIANMWQEAELIAEESGRY